MFAHSAKVVLRYDGLYRFSHWRVVVAVGFGFGVLWLENGCSVV